LQGLATVLFLFLSKFLPVFVLPLGASLVLFLLAGVLRLLQWKKISFFFFLTGFLYLWSTSLPITADVLCLSLEGRVQPVALQDAVQGDVIVVLGGILGQALPPRTDADLSGAADRILTAARLYRAGKAQTIVVAAGNLPWSDAVEPEAVLIKKLLVEWGVPGRDVILDSKSRNSYENAVNSRELLTQKGTGKVLLVTSAAHMPRAAAVFRKAGLDVFPVPTDYQVVVSADRKVFDYLPSVDALKISTMVIREWIGMQVYRARGWVE
jgi:uncharacterized SAM-binding protein YcdF (DUF218 family)